MNWKLPLTLIALLAFGGGAAYYLSESNHDHDASGGGHDELGHDDHGATEDVRGPHGGRLLRDDVFTLELAIFEQGVPPEFRAWFTQAGKSLAPDSVKLSVELLRPGGATDTHGFTVEGDYARGTAEVYEPHSFDYRIVAEHAGRTHRWSFAAPEMQTTISAAAARRAGVEIAAAGPAILSEILPVYGHVRLNANKVARAVPRFGGIVREARKTLGDTVVAGEVVALVETNLSLVTIEVTAPLDGIIVDRDVNAGETVGDGATLYTIADLTEVWIDLNIPKRDQARVRIGQSVVIHADDGGPAATGPLSWISPLSSAEAQTLIARVSLANSDQRWRPGLFVKADIVVAEHTVPVAVRESALQTLFDFTVVFSRHGDVYQARPLQLGRRGNGYVEVLKGLGAGESYVTENSFLIKADIGKSGASHDH
ncbi:MAG: efflux RND transporter periplasmic adaptor subunit [Candidatus Didemnitutus sp.]|nr:efflux RND transporter periplasmic adaptor subunit [Candidatus Didemnitutus sp.]